MQTFEEYTNHWLTNVVPLFKAASQATIRSHASKLIAAFGGLPLDLSYQTVQGYFTAQSKVLSPKTIRNVYSSLRLILSSAVREGLLEKVPQVALPKAVRQEKEWLTEDSMRRIVHEARAEYKPFYALLAETGLRIGEALGLQKQDINLSDMSLKVQRSVFNGRPQEPKTAAAYRTIALSKELCALLKPVVESAEMGEFLFHTASGKPWWPDKIAAGDLAQLFRDLRIEPVGFHGFRRGNATLMCSVLGMPEKIAAYRLGHHAPGITLGLYAQTWVGIDKDWSSKIGEILFATGNARI